ncbi:hypothetical protein HN51_037658 [Arachis hypogaea]|uniref:Glycosyltransferase family 92 protein n=1 Tax=Arachis hypogaea TaxID=3818 RepID=A0A444ZUX4_ARAHY|nr:glycosyltransferase family 92 protein RCOM_0530710-like [Arachis hypogaea]QHO03244.1 UPF0392 protein [Arachis hypogaea]RYR18041.1 hypothetical protein Ahy_B03g062673 isoform B [Arachis hypogaea]
MDSFSDQRRKRNHLSPPLFLSFSILLSLFLFLNHFHYSFHSPTSHSLLISTPLRLHRRILFPHHVLLTLANPHHTLPPPTQLQCLFYTPLNHLHVQPVLSTDRFDQFRSIVRCPLPATSSNFSAVYLRRRGDPGGGTLVALDNQTVLSWNNLAYEAELDGDTAVVFVKGLNLRPHRISDPTRFQCHFGLTGSQNAAFSITTKAVTVAQEVVRCSLPHSIKNYHDKAEEISQITVTVSHVTGHVRHPVHEVMPSVARVDGYTARNNGGARKNKHELCACTMVWNQARALREWVMYHSWLGVERWFVYDNNSDADDGIDGVVKDLDAKGYNVSRVTWPWIKTQEAGFSHCALKAKEHCNWVAFFDVDEFFHFPNELGDRKNALRSVVSNLSSSNSVAEIRTECRSFGPSGLRTHPKRGVSLGYTCRVRSSERHKSIVRPEMIDASLLNVVHHFELREGYGHRNIGEGSMVVNHYKYQVWESFKAKFHRRAATYVVDWHEDLCRGSKDRVPGLGTQAVEPANWRFRFCEVWDTGLRDFLLSNFAHPVTGLMPWETSNERED